MSSNVPQTSLAGRRGRGVSSLSPGHRLASPAPARTLISILPPYLLTPNDHVEQAHHPGTPAPAPDSDLEKLQEGVRRRREMAVELAAERSISEKEEELREESLTEDLEDLEAERFKLFLLSALLSQTLSVPLLLRFLEAQHKANDRLAREQIQRLTDAERTRDLQQMTTQGSEAVHDDTNVRACNNALSYRKYSIVELNNYLQRFVNHETTHTLRRQEVETLVRYCRTPPPPAQWTHRWPSSAESWEKPKYQGRYRSKDPWLAQGKKQYGHLDEGRPDSP